MKFKNVLMTFGLAAVLGLGVGAGLGANKEVKQVKAATSETTFYVDWSGSNWAGWTSDVTNIKVKLWHDSETDDNSVWLWDYNSSDADSNNDLSTITVQNVEYIVFSRVNLLNYTTGRIYSWSGESAQNRSANFTFEEATEGQNLLTVSGGGNTTGPSVAWGTLSIGNIFSVTKTAVEFDDKGVATGETWTLGDEKVESGVTFNTPVDPASVNLRHFEGWFSDAACATAYIPVAVNADMEIYAKFTVLTVDSYFYWTDKDSTSLTHIYFYGEYSPVAWPGAELSSFKVDDVLYFNGEGKLYKIPCPANASFKAVLSNGLSEEHKSQDLSVTPGQILYTWSTGTSSGTTWYNGNFVDATAADFVARVETARIAVPASSGILQYSVCGIDPEQARNLYNEYYDMNADNKALVNASYTYTYKGSYDGEHVPEDDNITFDQIMLSLKKVAEDGGYSVKGSASYIFATNASSQYSSTGIIVAVVIATSVLFVGGYFLLKKKRED